MDDADRADEEIERNLANAIRNASTAPPDATAEGYCLFCFEELMSGRWCGAECRAGWQRVRDASRHPRNIKPPPDLERA